MNIEKINQAEINYKAKVSPKFVSSMQGYINNGPNRLQNNYKLEKKIEEYVSFGFDDYTIEMHQRNGRLGLEYRLVAIKDNCTDKRQNILLTKKPYNAYIKIFNRFMSFNKHDFFTAMKARLNKNF